MSQITSGKISTCAGEDCSVSLCQAMLVLFIQIAGRLEYKGGLTKWCFYECVVAVAHRYATITAENLVVTCLELLSLQDYLTAHGTSRR